MLAESTMRCSCSVLPGYLKAALGSSVLSFGPGATYQKGGLLAWVNPPHSRVRQINWDDRAADRRGWPLNESSSGLAYAPIARVRDSGLATFDMSLTPASLRMAPTTRHLRDLLAWFAVDWGALSVSRCSRIIRCALSRLLSVRLQIGIWPALLKEF